MHLGVVVNGEHPRTTAVACCLCAGLGDRRGAIETILERHLEDAPHEASVVRRTVVHLASGLEPEQPPVGIAYRHNLRPPMSCRERADNLYR